MFGFKKKPIRFCKDCIYIINNTKVCSHHKATKPINLNYVTGAEKKEQRSCWTMRDFSHLCGERARYFEPKPSLEQKPIYTTPPKSHY